MPDDQKNDAAAQKPATNSQQPEKKFMPVPEDEEKLPGKPWSVNPNCKNNLIDRYGKEGGEKMYRRVALKYGHFDPLSEGPGYRPDLDEGDQIGELLEGK